MQFVHLHVHSHYSLLDGLPKIKDLIARVKELGMEAVALTDHGALYGAIEFYKQAKAAGIKPIIGQEFYVTPGSMHEKRSGVDDRRYHLTVLARNSAGYQNLIKLSTLAHLEGFYYKPRIDKLALREFSEGLTALSGCLNGEIPKAILSGDRERAKNLIREYESVFGQGNFFLELQRHPKLPDQETVNAALLEFSRELGVPVVATADSHYLRPEDSEAQDILMCVQTNHRLSDDDRLTMKEDDFSLKSAAEMAELFRDVPEAIENTLKIAERCELEITLGKTLLPHFAVPEDFTADTYLEKLCKENLERRYGERASSEQVAQRLAYELGVIKKTGFASYFLIVQDLVNWAKQRGIIVGPGRGSAAGSIVSYLLNITNIDPLGYDLLFERFLNPERVQMPDIDLDFADSRRNEVLEYVAEKYGRHHVAQIITFGTMAARAALRDTGRALGFPYEFCDRLAKLIPFSLTLEEAIETNPELREIYQSDPQAQRLIDAAKKLEGVARHASTHACGVVITKDPLIESVPLQRASQEDETAITQYEMHAVEDIGLLKIDFLGLANLTIIEETLKLISEQRATDIHTDTLPLNDERTFRLFQEGKTTGVFQFESAGMKRCLRELQPTAMEDLIATVALFRPGPMELIPKFIARKHGQEKVSYIHPIMEKILNTTYGVIVYQEQVMDLATEMAGLTKGEGYLLIKAVGKKIKSLLDQQKEKFIKGCLKNNIPAQIAQHTWGLIEPFARYGFNKAHSACYAFIGYQTAYLKANYPAEFMAALMNSESGDVERIAVLIEETRELGIAVLPPDINESGERFTVVRYDLPTESSQRPEANYQEAIRFGLATIKNVGENVVHTIAAERSRGGRFANLQDFLGRVDSRDLNKKSLEAMIKAGAFDSFGEERSTLLSNLEDMLRYVRDAKKQRESAQQSLFGENTPAIFFALRQANPAARSEKLSWEKELLGLYVSSHPLEEYRQTLQRHAMPIRDLESVRTYAVTIGGVVTRVQKIITKTQKTMLFVSLEDFSGKVEVVVFPAATSQYAEYLADGAVVLVTGRADRFANGGDTMKFICEKVERLNHCALQRTDSDGLPLEAGGLTTG